MVPWIAFLRNKHLLSYSTKTSHFMGAQVSLLFPRACRFILHCDHPDEFSPHPPTCHISWNLFLILYICLNLDLYNGQAPSCMPKNILCIFFISLEGWVHSLILAAVTLIIFDEQYLQVQNGLYNMTLSVVLKSFNTLWFKIIST